MIQYGHQTSTLHELPRELWGTNFLPWLWLWQLRSYNDRLIFTRSKFSHHIHETYKELHIPSFPLGAFFERETCLKQSLFQFTLEKKSGMQLLASIMQITVQTSPRNLFNRVIKTIYLYKTRGQKITLALDLLNRKRRWNNDFLNLVKDKLALFKEILFNQI